MSIELPPWNGIGTSARFVYNVQSRGLLSFLPSFPRVIPSVGGNAPFTVCGTGAARPSYVLYKHCVGIAREDAFTVMFVALLMQRSTEIVTAYLASYPGRGQHSTLPISQSY